MLLITSGGVAAVITWHAIFNGTQAIEHFDHDYQIEEYDALPHLYLVLVKDGAGAVGRPVAAYVIKTRDGHNEGGFADVISQCASACLGQERVDRWNVHLRPQKITADGGPLTENEMLRMTLDLLLVHSPASVV